MTAPEPEPPVQLGPTIGTTHVSETRNIQPPELTMPPPRPVPPEEAQRLLTTVDALDVSANRPERMRVVGALHALADALDVITPDRPNELLQLRHAIDELERGAPPPATEVELLQLALDAAGRALSETPRGGAVDLKRLEADVGELGRTTASLAPYRPLREQRDRVRLALRASVRAVFAATGAPEPVLAQIESPSGPR